LKNRDDVSGQWVGRFVGHKWAQSVSGPVSQVQRSTLDYSMGLGWVLWSCVDAPHVLDGLPAVLHGGEAWPDGGLGRTVFKGNSATLLVATTQCSSTAMVRCSGTASARRRCCRRGQLDVASRYDLASSSCAARSQASSTHVLSSMVLWSLASTRRGWRHCKATPDGGLHGCPPWHWLGMVGVRGIFLTGASVQWSSGWG
jgi:hypothetical protein